MSTKNKPHTVRDYGHETARIWDAIDDLRGKRRGRTTTQYVIGGGGEPTEPVTPGLWNLSNYMSTPDPPIANARGSNGLALDKDELIWKQLFNPEGLTSGTTIPVHIYKQHSSTDHYPDPRGGYDVVGYYWEYSIFVATESPGVPLQLFITKDGKIRSLNRWIGTPGSGLWNYEILNLGTINAVGFNGVLHSWSLATPSTPTYDGLIVDEDGDEWVMMQSYYDIRWWKVDTTDTVACPSYYAEGGMNGMGIIGRWFGVIDDDIGPLYVWSGGIPLPMNWKIHALPNWFWGGLHILDAVRLYYGISSLKALVPANLAGDYYYPYNAAYDGYVFVYDVPSAFTPDAAQASPS